MAFRSVMITNACYLQSTKRQLQITQNEQKFYIPLEDIACIVLNHFQIVLTANFLTQCAENNIVVISCNKTHLPNGIFHSFLPHSRQNLVLQTQLNLSKPFKNRIWQLIIQQKITNQATVLQRLQIHDPILNKLNVLARTVLSGDKNNNEAQASRCYFTELFGNDFTRITKNKPVSQNNIEYETINGLLNYTYTILRSLICRSIVGYGLLPTLGIFHNNQLNAFNLADDFIETYRPFIDWYVYVLIADSQHNELTVHTKTKLVDILNYIIVIDNKLTTVLNSCDLMVKSYISCINTNNYSALKLPSIPYSLKRSNMD